MHILEVMLGVSIRHLPVKLTLMYSDLGNMTYLLVMVNICAREYINHALGMAVML